MLPNPVSGRWGQRRENLEENVKRGGKRECPITCRLINELQYRLPGEIERPDFVAIVDENDRFVAKHLYLKRMGQNLSM